MSNVSKDLAGAAACSGSWPRLARQDRHISCFGAAKPSRLHERRPAMFSKPSLALTAAVALYAAATGGARADSMPTSTDEARAQAGSRTNDEINALETGNPHSVDFRNRVTPRRSTNDEIDAGETGNPHSVDFKSRVAPRRWATTDEINAAESGSPDSVGNK